MVTSASSFDTFGAIGLTDRRNSSTRGHAPTSQRLLALVPPTAPVATQTIPAIVVRSLDDTVIAIIDAPLAPGLTIMEGFREKERQIAGVFATLTIVESRTLHARLTSARPDDALVVKFGRLTSDRRARLIEFLAGARRREAISSARR